MWKCPVCDQAGEAPVCAGCGFDASRNYEQYPSFAMLPTAVKSIPGLSGRFRDTVRCSACGDRRFLIGKNGGPIRCFACGQALAAVATPQEDTTSQRDALAATLREILEKKTAAPEPVQKGYRVAALGSDWHGQCEVEDWENIIQIAAGNAHTVGLRADGTVVATGNNTEHQCDVGNWSGITQVAAGYLYTVGLRKDGSLLTTTFPFAPTATGWGKVKALAAGYFHTVGLKENGTVVTVGDNTDGQCDVAGWRDITAIAAGRSHTVGLRKDGTVMATGKSDRYQCNVSRWTDIVAIAAGREFTAGLQANGRLRITGVCNHTNNDPAQWTDLVAIAASGRELAALRSDGTLITTVDEVGAGVQDTFAAIAVGRDHVAGLLLPEE